jgi:hypothetical protein
MDGSNDMMFEYLLQMGAMQPEQQEMKRKQAMIDALRKQSMTAPEGQMIGKHYVAPSITQHLANLGGGYMAARGQKAQDAAMLDMNERQRRELKRLRDQRMMGQAGNMSLMTPTMPINPMMQFGEEGYE